MPVDKGRLLDLPDALRDVGVDVVMWDDFEKRGDPVMDPEASTDHHTVGSPRGDLPSGGVLANGRTGIPGPLTHVGQSRSNKAHCIASGRANHAGKGSWKGITGNSRTCGLERENVGTKAEPWTLQQHFVSARIHAAFALVGGFDGGKYAHLHKEWAPDRKIDAHPFTVINGIIVPDYWTGNLLRGMVRAILTNPTINGEEETMLSHYLFVQSLYETYAGRAPDEIDHDGISYWVGRCRAPESQLPNNSGVNADRVRDEFIWLLASAGQYQKV